MIVNNRKDESVFQTAKQGDRVQAGGNGHCVRDADSAAPLTFLFMFVAKTNPCLFRSHHSCDFVSSS